MIETNASMKPRASMPSTSLGHAAGAPQPSRRVLKTAANEPSAPSNGRDRVRAMAAPARTQSRCIEADLPDSITARRNVLTALWAGRLKGLSGDELTAYVSDVRFVSQRDEELIRTIGDDLRRAGVSLSPDEVRQALSRFHRVALHQACATD